MEEILAIATCPICLELKTNQVLLPCAHSFCLDDIELLLKRGNLACSLCRKGFSIPKEGLQALPKNFDRNSLAQKALDLRNSQAASKNSPKPLCECKKEATVYCIEDDDFLCSEHDALLHSHGKAKLHTRVLPSEKSSKNDPICPSHSRMRLDKWCCKCSKTVCLGK
jgi:hypothetical protein